MRATDYLQFLNAFPPGAATIILEDRTGESYPVNGLDPDIIGQRVPLLKESLDGRSGGPLTLTLGVPSAEAGAAVLHYLYFGHYALEGPGEPVEVKLLLHLEVYHIADYIGCTELAMLALGNLNLHTELSLSYSAPPSDLVPALIFAYAHLTENPTIIETLLNYCVTAFSIHKLGDNAEFKRLAATHETLVGDLSKINAERGFESADIPKLAGPQRLGPLQDFDIANLFAGPAVAENESPEHSRQNSSDSISAGGQQGPRMANLPIRVRNRVHIGELDYRFVFPAVTASPTSATATDDEFVICEKPGEGDSDSEWSLI